MIDRPFRLASRRAPRNVRKHRQFIGIERLEGRALLATTPPFPVGGDPIVNPADFRITTFATGLNYPHGMTILSDGSVLVGVSKMAPGLTSYYDGRNTGSIIRLADTDGDGVADGSGQTLFDGLPGQVAALNQAGNFLVATSSIPGDERISVLRLGSSPASPLTLVGSINFSFPGSWGHTTFASAVRPTPGQPGSFDVVFNVGSQYNGVAVGSDGQVVLDQQGNPTFQPTIDSVGVSGLVSGTLNGDSLYMVTLTDDAGTPVVSNPIQIATGLRNAASLAFDPVSGDLYLADNGIDGNNFRSNAWSTDEIDVVYADEIGNTVIDFGFPYSYVKAVDAPGDPVTIRDPARGRLPLVAFQPLADPSSPSGISKSEGASGFAVSPSMFPAGLKGIFVGFHGGFSSEGLTNTENPLVFADPVTGEYFNFIANYLANIGHLDEIESTADSLFIADISSSGSLGANGPGHGIIYQIKAINHAPTLAELADRPIKAGERLTFQASAADPDNGQSLRYTLGQGAPEGATIDPDSGLFSWTPPTGAGDVPVTIIVTDNGSPALSASRTFVVQVASNRAPVLPQIATQRAAGGQPFSLQIAATDPDSGQRLHYELGEGAPDLAQIDPDSGLFTWIPPLDSGDVTVMVRVTDDGDPALSTSRTFVIRVVTNHGPVVSQIPDQQAVAGQKFTLQVSATDPDAGQRLHYRLGAGAPGLAQINRDTGFFEWIPPADAGDVTVTVIAEDDGVPVLGASRTFVIHVVTNHAPTLSQIVDQQAVAGRAFSLQVAATDPDAGQRLHYKLGAGAPGLAHIDAETGLFTWTPPADAGDVPITIIAEDDGVPVLGASRTFVIHVFTNHAPAPAPIAPQQAIEGQPFALQISGSDPDTGQTLRYVLGPDAPAGAAIDPISGLFTWTPQQVRSDVPVTVIVSDDSTPSLSVSQTFQISVANAPIAPSGPSISLAATKGVATGNIVVGTFADADLDGSSSGYTASIDWGDYTRTTGQVAFLGSGMIQVKGSHVYSGLGAYPVVVTIRDGDGSSATSTTTAISVQPSAESSLLLSDSFNLPGSPTSGGSPDINAPASSRQSGPFASLIYREMPTTSAGTRNDSLTAINPAEMPGTLRLGNSLSAGQPFTYVSPARNFRTRRSTIQRIHVAVSPLGPGSTPGADHWAGIVFGTSAGTPISGKGTGVLLNESGNYQIWNRGKLVNSGQVGVRGVSDPFYSVDIEVNLRTGQYQVRIDGASIYRGKHGSPYSANFVTLESISRSGTGTQYDYFDDLAIEAVRRKKVPAKKR